REPMGFVAQPFDELAGRAVRSESDRVLAAWKEDQLLLFCQRSERQPKLKLPDRSRGHAELPLASVDEHQVGQRFPFIRQSFVTARDDFLDRREVVDARDRADAETPVMILIRLPALEADHGADRLFSLGMGD